MSGLWQGRLDGLSDASREAVGSAQQERLERWDRELEGAPPLARKAILARQIREGRAVERALVRRQRQSEGRLSALNRQIAVMEHATATIDGEGARFIEVAAELELRELVVVDWDEWDAAARGSVPMKLTARAVEILSGRASASARDLEVLAQLKDLAPDPEADATFSVRL